MADTQAAIEDLWARRDQLKAGDEDALTVVREAIGRRDRGELRVPEIDPVSRQVSVNLWLKYAILLLFKLSAIETMEVGPFEYADKVPLQHNFAAAGVRVVPGASARCGSFLE